jgi:hypothetical protein
MSSFIPENNHHKNNAAQGRDVDDFIRGCERETMHLDGCVLWSGHDGPCLLEEEVND